MRGAPGFWRAERPAAAARLLAPLAAVYGGIGRARRQWARPYQSRLPVLCVGNLTVGGAGKTPTALALARLLLTQGRQPRFLSRGYGGRLAGPVTVDPARHDYRAVGDEPLLLAAIAPVTVARDRAAGARWIEDHPDGTADAVGNDVIVMDDGFQNPDLEQTMSLIVIDAATGCGNGRVVPAGPLREPAAVGLRRADAVVVLGDGRRAEPWLRDFPGPILRASLHPEAHALRPDIPIIGFAGIGDPDKFRATLRRLGPPLLHFQGFPDHHPYRESDLAPLLQRTQQENAQLVTTEKDGVRLPAYWRGAVTLLPTTLVWEAPEAVAALLLDRLSPNAAGGIR